jgi:hypothetical protein
MKAISEIIPQSKRLILNDTRIPRRQTGLQETLAEKPRFTIALRYVSALSLPIAGMKTQGLYKNQGLWCINERMVDKQAQSGL